MLQRETCSSAIKPEVEFWPIFLAIACLVEAFSVVTAWWAWSSGCWLQRLDRQVHRYFHRRWPGFSRLSVRAHTSTRNIAAKKRHFPSWSRRQR